MGCLQSKCLIMGCSAEQPGLLYAARGSEGSSTQLCSKRAVISGKGITIFSNRAPSNYQILQKHLDVGICGFHPLGTFHCRHDDPAVDTGRWYANYGSVFVMKSLCKTSPTQFSPLYTNGIYGIDCCLFSRDILDVECVHPEQNTWQALHTLTRLYPICKQC